MSLRLGVAVLVAVFVAACGSSEATGPPEINYGFRSVKDLVEGLLESLPQS